LRNQGVALLQNKGVGTAAKICQEFSPKHLFFRFMTGDTRLLLWVVSSVGRAVAFKQLVVGSKAALAAQTALQRGPEGVSNLAQPNCESKPRSGADRAKRCP
jgi:hypothetical protein